MLKTCFMDSCG